MRNALVLLSSLALAAAASADPYSLGTSVASLSATYSMEAGVTLAPVVHNEYHPYGYAPGLNYYDFHTGDPVSPTNAHIAYSGSTAQNVPTGGGLLSLSATQTMRLDPVADTEFSYAIASIGHRAYLTFTNPTNAPATVTFTLDWSGNFSADASRPSNPAGDYIWDYAAGEYGLGLAEINLDNNNFVDPAHNAHHPTEYAYTYDFGTGAINGHVGATFDQKGARYSYILAGGSTHRYEIWAAAYNEVGFKPQAVPEPAALAALGLGALALLRRRRSASF